MSATLPKSTLKSWHQSEMWFRLGLSRIRLPLESLPSRTVMSPVPPALAPASVQVCGSRDHHLSSHGHAWMACKAAIRITCQPIFPPLSDLLCLDGHINHFSRRLAV